MAARLWPDSLFGRLAMILFSGLVAAHVLAFVLIALDRLAIEDELGNKFAAVDIADAVAILDYVEPKKDPPGSTGSLGSTIDTFSEMEESWKRSHRSDGKRTSRVCGPCWGPPTTRILSTSIHRRDCDGAYSCI